MYLIKVKDIKSISIVESKIDTDFVYFKQKKFLGFTIRKEGFRCENIVYLFKRWSRVIPVEKLEKKYLVGENNVLSYPRVRIETYQDGFSGKFKNLTDADNALVRLKTILKGCESDDFIDIDVALYGEKN